MRASVTLELPNGDEIVLGHGDLVGRVPSAALFLDDPRVSEAHAMVSLRGGRLCLLALRRLFAVDGRPLREVTLVEGLEVELAAGLCLRVLSVLVPDTVLGLREPDLGVRLLGAVTSLVPRKGGARVVSRFVPDAHTHLWWSGDGWRARAVGGDTRPLGPGDEIAVGSARFAVVELPSRAQGAATRAEGGIGAPMRLIASWDVAEVVRAGHPPLVLGGVAARILSELVAVGGSAHWETVAGEVWADGPAIDLRARWDVALNRLRSKLRAAEIRPDLVTMDGGGWVVLALGANDVIEDRT